MVYTARTARGKWQHWLGLPHDRWDKQSSGSILEVYITQQRRGIDSAHIHPSYLEEWSNHKMNLKGTLQPTHKGWKRMLKQETQDWTWRLTDVWTMGSSHHLMGSGVCFPTYKRLEIQIPYLRRNTGVILALDWETEVSGRIWSTFSFIIKMKMFS